MSVAGDVLVLVYTKEFEESPEKQIEQESDSVLGKSSNGCTIINENLSDFSSENAGFDSNENLQGLAERTEIENNGNDELTQLQLELWNLSQQEYYNSKKGLSKHFFSLIKKMKIGKVSKSCSICHSDYIKDEKIMKLPCSHIFHYDCLKTWLKISIYCPLCRLNLKEFFENAEKQGIKSSN